MRDYSVVHVYKAYPPVHGGIEGHIDLLTRLLVERGARAEVLCAAVAGAPAVEEREGVRVHRCATPLTVFSTPLPPGLPLALRRSDAELVHLHYPWPPGELAWLLGGRGRPLVITVHCEVIRQRFLASALSPLTRAALSRATRLIVSGSFMAAQPLLAGHDAKIRVVPFGVDLNVFRPDANVADPLPHVPHPRVLFVGRLRHYKGLPDLAAALARLPTAQLIVVGDGPERGTLVAALRRGGCEQRAHLLGEVPTHQLLRLLQTADVIALPSTSRAEAFGLAVAEAQACGVPAVVTHVGTATTATLVDGASGKVVRPHDPAALAGALAWCLEPGRSAALRAARAHAEAQLSAQRMVSSIETVYAEALAGAVAPPRSR